jgi:hypothetical protein
MAVLSNGADATVSPVDIPANEQTEIVELYRNALLAGCEAKLVSPTGKNLNIPRPVYDLLVEILKDLSEGSSVAVVQERQGLTTVQQVVYLASHGSSWSISSIKARSPTTRSAPTEESTSRTCWPSSPAGTVHGVRCSTRWSSLNSKPEHTTWCRMISLENEFSALLDTCTLVPISLCDLMLRLAESPALYTPKWSHQTGGIGTDLAEREVQFEPGEGGLIALPA